VSYGIAGVTSFAFGKQRRLLTSSDFSAVFNDAPFRASHPQFLILARPSNVHNARLGLVIAKKNVRLAVERNRIKRIARESFRLQHNMPPIDAIVLARRGADSLSNSELQQILNSLWKRVARKAQQLQTDPSQPGC
jgi:ribonuclease P protein component